MTNIVELLTDSRPSSGAVSAPDNVPADADPRWQLLNRVLESETFRRSQRLREFLHFVASQTLDGRSAEVSEHQIGMAVFHRGEHFNPAEDNIVRATVRSLRHKLRDYFEHEGASEKCRIEIPKGGYTPIFTEAPVTTAVLQQPALGSLRILMAVFLSVIACLSTLTLWLWNENVHLRTSQSGVQHQRHFLSSVLGEEFHLNVVTSDSLHVQLARFYPSLPRIEDYANGSLFGEKPPQGVTGVSPDLWSVVRGNLMTQSDETAAATHIAQQLAGIGKVKVYHARSITMAMLQVGDHFVLLGGRRANPWSGLFEQDLNFAMEFPEPGKAAIFRNRVPLPGEQSEYANNLDARNTGTTYGRIVLRPGVRGSGKVILATGNNGVATAASASLLTNPQVLQELESHLGRSVNTSLQQVEMIVENRVVSGNTKDVRVVAIR